MTTYLATTASGCGCCSCGGCSCWWFCRICSWRKTCCCFRMLEDAGSIYWLAVGLFCLAPAPAGVGVGGGTNRN